MFTPGALFCGVLMVWGLTQVVSVGAVAIEIAPQHREIFRRAFYCGIALSLAILLAIWTQSWGHGLVATIIMPLYPYAMGSIRYLRALRSGELLVTVQHNKEQ